MSEPWSASSLRPFFADLKSIQDWFDTSSPRIKSGEIDLQKINPQSALVAMILDPSLIRAPLMRIGDRCEFWLRSGTHTELDRPHPAAGAA